MVCLNLASTLSPSIGYIGTIETPSVAQGYAYSIPVFGILKKYRPILYLYEFVFKFIETLLGIFEAKQRISLDVDIYFVAIDGDIRSTYECYRPINRFIYANIHIISGTNADFKPNKTASLHNDLNHNNNKDNMCRVASCS